MRLKSQARGGGTHFMDMYQVEALPEYKEKNLGYGR